MKSKTSDRSKLLRQTRNFELVRRMRAGENLASFNSQASWYPPRPTIEKDPEAIEKLYGLKTVEGVNLSEATDDAVIHVVPMKVS